MWQSDGHIERRFETGVQNPERLENVTVTLGLDDHKGQMQPLSRPRRSADADRDFSWVDPIKTLLIEIGERQVGPGQSVSVLYCNVQEDKRNIWPFSSLVHL